MRVDFIINSSDSRRDILRWSTSIVLSYVIQSKYLNLLYSFGDYFCFVFDVAVQMSRFLGYYITPLCENIASMILLQNDKFHSLSVCSVQTIILFLCYYHDNTQRDFDLKTIFFSSFSNYLTYKNT